MELKLQVEMQPAVRIFVRLEEYRVAPGLGMAYNGRMATSWKIYQHTDASPAGEGKGTLSAKWDDTEAAELVKLARGATETARQSIKLINAAKAEACRKQLLQEMKGAR